jgi:hypothetical protein
MGRHRQRIPPEVIMHAALNDIPSVDNDLLTVGDVPLAPFGLTGLSEVQLARSMAGRALAGARGPEALALLPVRTAFLDSPLSFRLGALAALMRRA